MSLVSLLPGLQGLKLRSLVEIASLLSTGLFCRSFRDLLADFDGGLLLDLRLFEDLDDGSLRLLDLEEPRSEVTGLRLLLCLVGLLGGLIM